HIKKDVLPGLEQKHTELSGQIKARETELRGQLEKEKINETLPSGSPVPKGPGISTIITADGSIRVQRPRTPEEVQAAVDADPKLGELRSDKGKVSSQLLSCKEQLGKLADAK